ncbi:MAG: ORF6N domain-containing protein [Lachnospiraceae bacterium]|nr:ORF6N domain-containing protein [Lachnospiraceae bacterium]
MAEEEKNQIELVENIESLVYTIRGVQVMLDTDLARLYGYEVKALNQQVKRNIERFPEDFMFKLTENELVVLRSQNVTANISSKSRALPYAFTEQGTYMLATVLKSDIAVAQSIAIMRAFRNMKHYLIQYQQFVGKQEFQELAATMDERMGTVERKIDELSNNFISDTERKEIVVYKGQKFEADIFYIKIYTQAKKTIYVVDNYMNFKTLELLSHKQDNVAVTLFTNNLGRGKGKLTNTEVNDFNNQYPTMNVKPNNETHDRLVVVDYKTPGEKIFHCGASSKDAGKSMCAINEISDVKLYYPVIDKLILEPDITL